MARLSCLVVFVSLISACSDGLITIESATESPFAPGESNQTTSNNSPDTGEPTNNNGANNNSPDTGEPVTDNNSTNNNSTNNATNGTTDNGPEPEPEPTCTTGMLCGTECVDINQNNSHCGACDNRCTGGQVCNNATCVTLSEVEGVLLESNQVRATGADCGVYGTFEPTTPLTLDPHLNEAAQAHAQDMADNDFFSHTGSDGSSFSVRVGRTSFSGFPIGENIAAGQRGPADVVASWINSDGHCRNIMNPSASKIGIGYTTGGPYGTLWVQVFGQ